MLIPSRSRTRRVIVGFSAQLRSNHAGTGCSTCSPN